MIKKLFIYIVVSLGILTCLGFVLAKIEKDSDSDGLSDYEEEKVYQTNPINADTDADTFSDGQEVKQGYSPLAGSGAKLTQITLPVVYINEAPDDNWTGPWKNACEEASMAMVENYYLSKKSVSIKEAKNFMQAMFNTQNKLYGSNADSDATRTASLINNYSNFNGLVIDNPTVEQIKQELQQKRPVISLHYGFDLQNKNIPFVPAPRGSSYHMMVIIGYDDNTQEFITNDTGDRKQGQEHRYNYELFMNSLHDFIYAKRQASGTPRVIFTYPKLAKLIDSPRIYYLQANQLRYIPNEKTFNAKGWNWDAINVVDSDWLNKFNKGEDIKP